MDRAIMAKLFPEMQARKDNGLCPGCGRKIDPDAFTDELSRREYKITGMCQSCQDDIAEYETEGDEE